MGKGGLDGTSAQGETDPIDWMNHVVDAKTFSANGPREKDSVKKSQHPCGKAGGCQKKGAGDQGVFFKKIGHKGSGKRILV